MKWQFGARHCASVLLEEVTMTRKQLFALSVCSLVPLTVGNGLLPLLPVYAVQVGATPAVAGYYLSFSFLTLATGTVVAGWLSNKLQRRKALLVVASVVSIPGIWLMGLATNIWQLAALTAAVWFLAGMGITLLSILTGLFAEEGERGKAFGILSLTGALGALIGGTTTGPIADRWGYPTMFAAVSLFLALWPLTGLLLEDKVVERVRRGETSTAGERPRLGGGFFLLLLASLGAAVVNYVCALGTSLAMNELGFVSAAISSTMAVGGAVTLPLPPLIGWLSDRVGRKRLLALCYLAGTVGLLLLAVSVSLYHFWVANSLLSVLAYVGRGVGSALVTDLASQESLGRGISLFSATTWIGGIIGFAGTGYAVQHLGMAPTFIVGAFLPLIAIILLIPIRQAERGEGSAAHLERRRITTAAPDQASPGASRGAWGSEDNPGQKGSTANTPGG
jgi:MFS family permease